MCNCACTNNHKDKAIKADSSASGECTIWNVTFILFDLFVISSVTNWCKLMNQNNITYKSLWNNKTRQNAVTSQTQALPYCAKTLFSEIKKLSKCRLKLGSHFLDVDQFWEPTSIKLQFHKIIMINKVYFLHSHIILKWILIHLFRLLLIWNCDEKFKTNKTHGV